MELLHGLEQSKRQATLNRVLVLTNLLDSAIVICSGGHENASLYRSLVVTSLAERIWLLVLLKLHS